MARTRQSPDPTAIRLADLEAYAAEVFGSAEDARAWMQTPLSELGNLTPIQAVTRNGEKGFESARAVLTRLEYGVYS